VARVDETVGKGGTRVKRPRPEASSKTSIHPEGQEWEGSTTTVVYTVVWRNSMVWWSGGYRALWLA